MTTDFESIDSALTLKSGDGLTFPTRLADDLSLFISTPQGLVVIMGCAHRGMINILRQAKKVTGHLQNLPGGRRQSS